MNGRTAPMPRTLTPAAVALLDRRPELVGLAVAGSLAEWVSA